MFFSVLINDPIIFLLYSVYILNYGDCFSKWNQPYILGVSFNCASTSVEDFYTYVHEGHWYIIFLKYLCQILITEFNFIK